MAGDWITVSMKPMYNIVCWMILENFGDTHSRTHTYIHQYTYTYVHTYVHTYIHTYIHSYIHTYIHTHIHIYIHTYMYTHVCTHYNYIHTYLHTYIHTCIIWQSFDVSEQFAQVPSYTITISGDDEKDWTKTLHVIGTIDYNAQQHVLYTVSHRRIRAFTYICSCIALMCFQTRSI